MSGLTPFFSGPNEFKVFDNFLRDNMGFLRGKGFVDGIFRIDIKDTDDNYIIEAEMAGIKKDDISVNFEDSHLILSVNKKNEDNEKNDNYICRERFSKSMKRIIPLENVDREKISAKLEDGILTVIVPKLMRPYNSSKIEIL